MRRGVTSCCVESDSQRKSFVLRESKIMSFEKGLFLRERDKFPSALIHNLQPLQQSAFFCFNCLLHVERGSSSSELFSH